MSNIQKGSDSYAVEGSTRDIAQRRGVPLEEIIADAEVICLVDRSGSMDGRVYEDTAETRAASSAGQVPSYRYNTTYKTRIQCAREALEKLQRKYQGKVLVFQFDSQCDYCPSGYVGNPRGGTDVEAALLEVKEFDGAGLTFFVISDGEPNDGPAALTVASTFIDPIHTIYIGNANPRAEQFMSDLANNGGIAAGKIEPEMLTETVFGLLEEGKGK